MGFDLVAYISWGDLTYPTTPNLIVESEILTIIINKLYEMMEQ